VHARLAAIRVAIERMIINDFIRHALISTVTKSSRTFFFPYFSAEKVPHSMAHTYRIGVHTAP
jgi:hypothetical protein